MKELSDARPCLARATSLAWQMDSSLLDTIEYLVRVAQESLDESFAAALAHVGDSRHSICGGASRLRGSIYSLNAELENLMRAGDATSVRTFVHKLASTMLVAGLLGVHELGQATLGQFEEECFFNTINREFSLAYGETFRATAPANFDFSKACLETALQVLREIDPDLAAEVIQYVTEIIICKSDQVHAGSSFRAFGAVYLRELQPTQHWTAYLEHVTHEAAHIHLYSIWKSDPIVLNESSGRFSSPLRKDPRPLSGIYHAMFVLARLLRVSKKLKRDPRYRGLEALWVTSNNNAGNVASLEDKFEDAYLTIKRNAELTSLGRELAEGAREMAYE